MSDAKIVQVTPDDGATDYDIEDALKAGQVRLEQQLPTRYATATVTDPAVAQWVRDLVAEALTGMRSGCPVVRTGPSLALVGNAGRGKTWQAWGALRALSVSGVYCRWQFVTASDMFGSLRPRHGVDSEDVFEDLAGAAVLVIDDLGAAKDSAWTEDMLCRIVDRRSKWCRATLITTNVPPPMFSDTFGNRVASRLAEMATTVPFLGPDLRRQASGVR
jgi:DNA replication protein DnaC